MRSAESAELRLRPILETDRAWTAYALADLFPPWNAHAEWFAGEHSALLIYHGLQPPILFAHGEPGELDRLLAQLPAGDYWYTLRPTDFSRLEPRLNARTRDRMWRMWLPQNAGSRENAARRVAEKEPDQPHVPVHPGNDRSHWEVEPLAVAETSAAIDTVPLGMQDVPAIERLYSDLQDGPDAFVPEQLEHGIYFGVREGEQLLSVAGTHVACRELSVAALGNVATRPQLRGKGLGYGASLAVIRELRRRGYHTIVLNVRMDNRPAVQLYRKLGFMPFCGFYEGRGSIS